MKKISMSPGRTLLGIWLIANGISPWIHIAVPGYSQVLALIALAAGVLILVGR